MHKLETVAQRQARTKRSHERRIEALRKRLEQQAKMKPVKPPAKTKPRFTYEPSVTVLVARNTRFSDKERTKVIRTAGTKYLVPALRATYVDRNKYHADGSLRKVSA